MKHVDCPICHDQGIVELAGRRTIDGYSRGSAPCQWCDQGKKLQKWMVENKHHPLTDYSMHSIASQPEPHYDEVTKEEALADWESCTHDHQPIGPPQARPWANDSIQWETCSRCGKEQATTIPTSSDHSARRTTP